MVEIKKYDDPNEFYRSCSPLLLLNESENNLLLGLSQNFLKKPEMQAGLFSIFHKGQLVGCFVFSRYLENINLISSKLNDSTYAELITQQLKEEIVRPNVIIAEHQTALLLIESLKKNGVTATLVMEQGVYRCTKVIQPPMPPKTLFRIAVAYDAPLLAKWTEAFHAEAVPEDPPVSGADIVKSRLDNKMLFVCEANSQVVSMASWARDVGSSCAVNLVYTPKSLRGHGYASWLTAQLTQHLLSNGKKEVTLYTDWNNSTSNKIYKAIGYDLIGQSLYYKLT